MIFYHSESHGAIYTLDEETRELYYAPIYQNNTINLSEFCPIDLSDYDDLKEIQFIQSKLTSLTTSKKTYETLSY